MVKDSRAPPGVGTTEPLSSQQPVRSSAIRPLNAPLPVQVRTDAAGIPLAVRTEAPAAKRGVARRQRPRHGGAVSLKALRSDDRWLGVASIKDVWRVNDEWWRGRDREIERIYFSLTLENSQHMTVFHDLIAGEWRRQAE